MASAESASSESERKDSVHAPEGYQWQNGDLQGYRTKDVLNASSYREINDAPRRSALKRKDESLWDTIRSGIVNHQLGLSINCVLLLAMTHLFFPSLRPTTSQFFSFSYRDEQTGLYDPGLKDLNHVLFWIVVFTGLRAATIDYILIPYAKWCGITKKKTCLRFAEQGWLLLYYIVFWTVGMYLYYTSSYWANLSAMWTGYPKRSMTGLFKFYYLAQFAFWPQQIFVIHIEERRKDHWQMLTHHIITSMLMLGSYGSYQTRVGNVILCLMDVVDLFFPAAKMLRYAGKQTLCDIAFGVFMVSWLAARHIGYLSVCWSLIFQAGGDALPYGCYDAATGAKLSDDPGQDIMANIMHVYTGGSSPVCWNQPTRLTFLSLLLALQVITIVWGAMIVRVAYKVLSGQGADDSRSDDEGDDEEEFDTINQHNDFADKAPEVTMQMPLREEEVGVEELRFMRKSSPPKKRNSKNSKARASGISIPGHGDKKELLGRIGCDKPSS